MSLKEFELGKELGKGAFGSVCLAKRKEDCITYAMKRVKISSLSSKEIDYALNEIRILASLSHPNIIGYKEAFFDESSKTLNIVMDLADDGDIAAKIAKNTKSRLVFQESTIWIWLIQILEGLNYLHQNKIMHRDLKSANLFLMKNGMLKLGDLNVSKLVKMGMALTQTGTPYYCSPEIWLDKPYDYKSDIWSVGCIVYELATLKPPFQGTSLKELSNNIIKGVYNPISSIYSRELSKIISQMLVVDPNYRMSTEQLLKDEIILSKISEYKDCFTHLVNKAAGKKPEMIQTIKLPKNIKEINKALPRKKYSNQIESEMGKNNENDEVSTNKKVLLDNEKENKALGNNQVESKNAKARQSIISQRPHSNYRGNDQLQDKKKNGYYYKHCINPFAKEEPIEEKQNKLCNVNTPNNIHKAQVQNNKSPLSNRRPKSSQHRPSNCEQYNNNIKPHIAKHNNKPSSNVKPIIIKSQFKKPQKDIKYPNKSPLSHFRN